MKAMNGVVNGRNKMTTHQKFDLIAPIAIYHFADCCYEERAKKNFEEAVKAGLIEEGEGYDTCNDAVLDLYNGLFVEIVKEERDDWSTFIDRYGANGFRDGRGFVVFTGDSSFRWPWYETAELLIKRIEQHEEEDEDGD